jgi:hypothetical protein
MKVIPIISGIMFSKRRIRKLVMKSALLLEFYQSFSPTKEWEREQRWTDV